MQSEQSQLTLPLIRRAASTFSAASFRANAASVWPSWQSLPRLIDTPLSPSSRGQGLRLGTLAYGEGRGAEPRWWWLLPILMLQFGGLALIVPALPNLKLRFFGGDAVLAAHVQSLTDSTRAVLTTCVSGALGRLSDSMGRRPLVLLSICCTLAPLLSLVLTSNLYPYFALFVVAGALGGQSSPAISAYVADCCPHEARAKTLGVIGAATSLVFMVVPLLGGLVSMRYGQPQLFAAGAALEGLAAAVVLLGLPESLPALRLQPPASPQEEKEVKEPVLDVAAPRWAAGNTLSYLLRASNRKLWPFVAVRLLRGMAFSGSGTVFYFTIMKFVPLNDADFGILISLSGLAGILGQVVLLRLFLRLGCTELPLLLVAACVSALQHAGNLLLPVFPSRRLIAALILISAAGSMGDPAFTALVTKGVQEDFGLTLGVFSAVDGLTSCIAPIIFSHIFAISPLAPFALAATLHATAAAVVASMWCAGAAGAGAGPSALTS